MRSEGYCRVDVDRVILESKDCTLQGVGTEEWLAMVVPHYIPHLLTLGVVV
jgi:hypothetical protein